MVVDGGSSGKLARVAAKIERRAEKETFGSILTHIKRFFFFTSSRHSVQGQNMLRAAFISFSPSIAQQ